MSLNSISSNQPSNTDTLILSAPSMGSSDSLDKVSSTKANSSTSFADLFKNVIEENQKLENPKPIEKPATNESALLEKEEGLDESKTSRHLSNEKEVGTESLKEANPEKMAKPEDSILAAEAQKLLAAKTETKAEPKNKVTTVFDPKSNGENKSFQATEHKNISLTNHSPLEKKVEAQLSQPEVNSKALKLSSENDKKIVPKEKTDAKDKNHLLQNGQPQVKPEQGNHAIHLASLHPTNLVTKGTELKSGEGEIELGNKKNLKAIPQDMGKLSQGSQSAQNALLVSVLASANPLKSKENELEEKLEGLKKGKETKTTKGKGPIDHLTGVVDPNAPKTETSLITKVENAPTVEAATKKEASQEKIDFNLGSTRDVATQSYGKTSETTFLRSQSTDMLQKIVGQIRMAIVSGREEMTMKIQPESLGKITLTLGKEQNGLLTGTMIVESQAVKEMLDTQMLNLKDHLQAMGFEFSQINVDIQQDTSKQLSENLSEDKGQQNSKDLKASSEDEGFQTIDLRYSEKIINLVA